MNLSQVDEKSPSYPLFYHFACICCGVIPKQQLDNKIHEVRMNIKGWVWNGDEKQKLKMITNGYTCPICSREIKILKLKKKSKH